MPPIAPSGTRTFRDIHNGLEQPVVSGREPDGRGTTGATLELHEDSRRPERVPPPLSSTESSLHAIATGHPGEASNGTGPTSVASTFSLAGAGAAVRPIRVVRGLREEPIYAAGATLLPP
jgi:hypothetical protein